MRIVLAHGVFDVLHIGHIRLLKYARNLGDYLVVSLLADKFVTMYKSPSRPINPLDIRIEQMEALRYVSNVVVVNEPGHEAVERMIASVMPHVYVRGAESQGRCPEQAFAESRGIKVVFMDMVKLGDVPSSTTRLLASV